MGFISDLFGGAEGPKQRDIDQVSGRAQEQESARLRGLMKRLRQQDGVEEGVDFAESGLIQFGSDTAEANVFGRAGPGQDVTERADPRPEFEWTLGKMPAGLDHSETLDWFLSQDGILEEGGISQDDVKWLQQWMREAGASDHAYLFKDDFDSGPSGWDWNKHINETNQTRLREFIALQDMYAPQLD